MRRVLIVSFLFPPTNSIGAVRIGKFAKHLPEFGWEPVVLTAETLNDKRETLPVEMDQRNIHRAPYWAIAPSASQRRQKNQGTAPPASPSGQVRQPSRLSKLAAVMAAAAKQRANSMLLWFPILHELVYEPVGWYPTAVRKGREVLSRNKVDVMFSSHGPSLSHLVASRLQRDCGLPWVADFRDLWALNYNKPRNRLADSIECRLEKMVIARASALLGASEPIADSLSSRHRKQTLTLLNGFDEEDYSQTVPQTPFFSITYTGALYGGKRAPDLLFRALSELKQERRIAPGEVAVRFFGTNPAPEVTTAVKDSGLEDMVTFYDRIPFRDSIARQQESTVLLLVKWADPSVKGFYSSKLFEYLGAGRPILAVGAYEDRYVDGLITRAGVGAPVRSVESLKELLLKWLAEWRESGRIASHWNPRPEVVRQFTRREQARQLARLLDEVTSPTSETHNP